MKIDFRNTDEEYAVNIQCTLSEYTGMCAMGLFSNPMEYFETRVENPSTFEEKKHIFDSVIRKIHKSVSNEKFCDEPLGSFNRNYITKVIYQNPATIVFWSDGTKTVSKCDENDTYDEEKGLILCIMKKVFPNKNIGTLLGMWTSGSADTYGKNTITLKQARKMEKEFSVYWNAITGKKGEN